MRVRVCPPIFRGLVHHHRSPSAVVRVVVQIRGGKEVQSHTLSMPLAPVVGDLLTFAGEEGTTMSRVREREFRFDPVKPDDVVLLLRCDLVPMRTGE